MSEDRLINPYFNFWAGDTPCQHRHMVRTLSDAAENFHDAAAARDRLKTENPVIYEFHEYVATHTREDLIVATCAINPGRIGNEFFMTRGHFHDPSNYVEIYYVAKGKGILVMQSADGRSVTAEMTPGSIFHVPPDTFHRSVNVGDEPLVFFGVYSGEADHDYSGRNLAQWVSKLVVEAEGKVAIIDNPNCQRGVVSEAGGLGNE